MAKSVLIAYASRHGNTAETAEFIGNEIRDSGLDVQVGPAAEIEDITMYDAILLGTAIKGDKVMPEAVAFAERFRNELNKKPTAFFGLSMLMAEPTDENRKKTIAILNQLRYEMRPLDIGVFGGVRDPQKLSWVLKWAVRRSNIATGDYRDWDKIKNWATRLAGRIKEGKPF